MSLIIALILIVVVWASMSNNKTKVKEYERKRNAERAAVEEWKTLYVDKELEKVLIACISENENYDAVYKEVSDVVANMKYWKYLLDSGFPLNEDQIEGAANYKQAYEEMVRNREIALDIMLAKRGKVSFWASMSGYKAFVRNGTTSLKEAHYEYAETILNIMRRRGAQIELFYLYDTGAEYYRWTGSSGERFGNDERCIIKSFDRSLFQPSSFPVIE